MTDDLIKRFGNVPSIPPDVPIFDISTINLVELGRQLQKTLSAGRSKWIFFKRRGNEKAILDEEHLRALIAQIQDLRDMNSQLLELNADVYLTQERLGRIIQRYREQENFVDAEGYRLGERAVAEHESQLQILKDEATRRKKELEILDAEINNKKAETEILNTTKTREDLKVQFMKKVMDTINLNELPDYLRTFVINSIFNPNQQITGEMQLMEKLEDFVVRKEAAAARGAEAEAKAKESQADIGRTTADKTIYDFNRLKKGGNE